MPSISIMGLQPSSSVETASKVYDTDSVQVVTENSVVAVVVEHVDTVPDIASFVAVEEDGHRNENVDELENIDPGDIMQEGIEWGTRRCT